MANILIKNGRVWDGNAFLEVDILTDGPKIGAIGPNLEGEGAFVYDANGMLVTPGLVDTHIHMSGPEPDKFGIQAELSTIPFGVTAAADAGGAHADHYLAQTHQLKNVTFVTVPIRDNAPDFAPAERKLALYGDLAIGLKVYFDTNNPHVRSSRPLAEVCAYAKSRSLKVMVHCSNSPTAMAEYLPLLSAGDILTHAYHGGNHSAADDSFSALLDAKKRGIVIDSGFAGHIHTDLEVFKAAVAAGVLPDTISTDITRASAYMRGGRYGMTMCMSMALTAGMQEADILRAVTTTPAKVLKKEGLWGCLKPGGTADIAVFDYTNEGYCLTDRFGGTLSDTRGYRCKLTVSDGVILWRD